MLLLPSVLSFSKDESSVIGRGSWATVHRVALPNAVVAVKCMTFSAKNKLSRTFYENERRVFWRLQDAEHNDTIVRHHSIYVHGNEGFIVMELVPGRPLGLVADIRGRHKLVRQLFDALAYLRQKAVAHRDLKPENIMYDPETHAMKLIDFGFAHVGEPGCSERAYERVGTPYYMAPELILDETKAYDPYLVDIWSAGCLLYYMHTGKPPLYMCNTMKELQRELKTFNALVFADDLEEPCMKSLFLWSAQVAPDMRRDASTLSKQARHLVTV